MKNLVYICSTIILFVLFLILKKSEKKFNFVFSFILNVVCLFCYNIVICYFNNLLNIPLILPILSLENLIIGSIFLIISYKKKEIQQFYLDKKDLYIVLLLIAIVAFIVILNCGIPLKIKYFLTDAYGHYSYAQRFSETYKFIGTTRPGAYINLGILFMIFSSLIGKVYLFKIYILFDAFQWFMIGILTYMIMKKYIKSNKDYIIAFIMAAMAMIGYPLNIYLMGFQYLASVIFIFLAQIYIWQLTKEKILNNKFRILILFLTNFGVLFTYYYLSPICLLTTFLLELFDTIKNKKKIFSKKNIIFAIIVFLIPVMCCFELHFLPRLFKKIARSGVQMSSIEGQATLEGFIYRNLIGDYIPFLLICLWAVILKFKNNFNSKIKNKIIDLDYLKILDIVFIVFLIITFTLMKIGKLSSYGFFKAYYLLWPIATITTFVSIKYLYANLKNKKCLTVLLTIYIFSLLLFLVVGKSPIRKSNTDFGKFYNVFNIYGTNKSIIFDYYYDLDDEGVPLIKYLRDNNIKEDKKTLIIAMPRTVGWLQMMSNNGIQMMSSDQYRDKINDWFNNEGEYKYLIIFKNVWKIFNIENMSKNDVLIYETDNVMIYKKDI